MGFEWQHVKFSTLQPPWSRGQFNFDGVYTDIPKQNNSTTGIAQMLLIPTTSTVGGPDYVGGPNNIYISNISLTDNGKNYYGTYFNDDWKVTLRDAGSKRIERPRLIPSRGTSALAAHKRLIAALANPTYTREVIMFTSGILSAAAARKAYEGGNQHDLQFVYFLASVRSTFDRAGVRYRIICNP